MFRGNARVFVLAIAVLAIPATRATAQDGGKPPAGDVAGTSTSTTPEARRDAELRELRERVEALERERAAERAKPVTLDLNGRVEALEAKQKAADDAANDPDYSPEVVPFSEGDLSWVPGNYGPSKSVLKWGPFTGEVRADAVYHWEQANPVDNTISGSSEVFRANELQLTQLGVGGDFYYKGAQVRLMTQFGMYSQTTPRNDASPSRGQWNLDNAYRYISEAYGGYHFNALHGINVDAGIFMSYVGL